MSDPGWDEWDLRRVLAVLWPGSEDGPEADLWPKVRISPSSSPLGQTDQPVRASEIEPRADAHVTYWAWAEGTPFVKIGQTQYAHVKVIQSPDGSGRRVVIRGVLQQADDRVDNWTTGTPWAVRILRVHVDDKRHERGEHARYAAARMPGREWFDLRRLEKRRRLDVPHPTAM
jgi:hypothetical protein